MQVMADDNDIIGSASEFIKGELSVYVGVLTGLY